jgi:TyrR family helix-turn-helix protein
MSKLMNYDFPGNIRELKNIIKMAVVLNEDEVLDDSINNCLQPGQECFIPKGKAFPGSRGLKEQVASFEKKIIEQAMKAYTTTRELADHLKVSQPTIVRKLKRYNLVLRK